MFKKILIANRGEIALRIIWACRELGIQTVAVYSEADSDSLHVKFADEDVCIGPAQSQESYLNISRVLTAAEITGADAIHPGYGFLAESSHFAEVCEACRICFIGPPAAVIRMMGDKVQARAKMRELGIPILPGTDGPVKNLDEGLEVARRIGYPIIVKAAAGGGGRGMRIVDSEGDLAGGLETAKAESKTAFGQDEVYIERYLKNPRHIEVQILADTYNNVVHLGERECSLQRRHQKILEESPSTALTPKLRREITATAVRAARSIGYQNAGTIEFLLDETGKFYFMEMNPRIQVEHPVTEMVTGIDLIKEQIRVAAGDILPYTQKDIHFSGHSIECRINAEDPWTFRPSPGLIRTLHLPGGPGVRVDTAAHPECMISPFYDSMVAKLITRGNNRMEAISRMKRSLESMVIEGIQTNIPLHLRLLSHPDFVRGNISTHFIDEILNRKRERAVS
ncbi:MAG: acetyl-CoA carboxylase biotin carboxylase subunit [Acidobacteriota bacterium]